MAPRPQFFESTYTTQIAAAVSASVNAGSSVAAVTYVLANDKNGTLGADTLSNARLRVEAFDGANWVTSGLPVVDEGWVKVQVTGTINNTGDANMTPQSSGYISLGTNRTILLEDIPQNCARYLSVKIDVPSGSSTSTPETRLVVVFNESVVVLPFRFGILSGSGVIPARKDASLRKITRGRTLTAAAQIVTIAKGRYVYDGTTYFRIEETVTLNQTAADGALAVGQSYIAVISQPQNAAATATKGNKGAAPTSPALPAGHILLGRVTVPYDASGSSVLSNSNISTTGVTFGEYLVTAGSGLNVVIGSGSAISSEDTSPFRTTSSTLAVTDNANNYIWLHSDGTFSATTTSAVPAVGAQLLAIASAAAGAVATPTDARAFVDTSITEEVITLRYMGSAAVVTDADWGVLSINGILDSYALNVGAIGSIGGTKVDILYRAASTLLSTAGTTIFTSSGTSDLRPRQSAAGGVTTGQVTGADHEVLSFDIGTRFSFSIVEIPSIATSTDVIVTLRFRKR